MTARNNQLFITMEPKIPITVYLPDEMNQCIRQNKWSAALLAVLLLFVTSGFALSRMTCLSAGHSVVSVGLADDCCPDDAPSAIPVVKATCCAITQAVGYTDPFTQHVELALDLTATVVDQEPVRIALFQPTRVLPRGEAIPPPLLLSVRLAANGSFLI